MDHPTRTPLTETTGSFHALLEKGHGRAQLLLAPHNAPKYRDALISAITRDLRFDRQCEDSRGLYLYELINRTGEAAVYREVILRNLAPESDDTARRQAFRIARYLVAVGDGEMHEAMYGSYARGAATGDWTGADALITLDGLDGFLFVADNLPPDVTSSDIEEAWWWESLLGEHVGEEAAARLIQERCTGTAQRTAILEAVRAHRTRCEAWRTPRPRLSYAELRAQIAEDPRKIGRVGGMGWGSRAKPDELELAAADLRNETEPDRLYAYLGIFARAQFPGDHTALIRLVRHDDQRVARAAVYALAHVTHPTVRALALELASEPGCHANWAALLAANFELRDWDLIEQMIKSDHDRQQMHGMAIATLNVLDAHKSLAAAPALTLLYDLVPCSFCRGSVVRQLISLNQLPDWMREECAHDAVLDTRELVNAIGACGPRPRWEHNSP